MNLHRTFTEPPVKSWSPSAIKMAEECLYRVYLQRVEKAPVPDLPPDNPLSRGERLHKLAENFVSGQIESLPKELQKFTTEFNQLRDDYKLGNVELEQKWGFADDWTPTDWFTAWGRIMCDVVRHDAENLQTLEVIDHKSGKSMGKEVTHGLQMQAYAIAAFMRYPMIEIIKTNLWYLDEGKQKPKIYTRAQAIELLPRLMKRIERLTTALVFTPKPNRVNCRFCDYGIEKGTGACAYAVGST